MGSTKYEGGSLQYVLQFNQTKTPKPQRLEIITRIIQVTTTYKGLQRVTMTNEQDTQIRYKIYNLDTNIHKIQQDVSDLHT